MSAFSGKELAARMIFRPRELRRAKDAALMFHEPIALHRARSVAASAAASHPTASRR